MQELRAAAAIGPTRRHGHFRNAVMVSGQPRACMPKTIRRGLFVPCVGTASVLGVQKYLKREPADVMAAPQNQSSPVWSGRISYPDLQEDPKRRSPKSGF